MRIANAIAKRQFGKVIMPMRVIYARKPKLLGIALRIKTVMDRHLAISTELSLLLRARISFLNGCRFCRDMSEAVAIKERIGQEKFRALSEWQSSSVYSERERAALAYVEAIAKARHVTDAVFAELRRHFSDAEIIDITWLNAAETYFNCLAGPLEIPSDNLAGHAASKM